MSTTRISRTLTILGDGENHSLTELLGINFGFYEVQLTVYSSDNNTGIVLKGDETLTNTCFGIGFSVQSGYVYTSTEKTYVREPWITSNEIVFRSSNTDPQKIHIDGRGREL